MSAPGGVRSSRRADELRKQPDEFGSLGRRLYRSHPQRYQACGPAGRATEQVRAGDQQPDSPDARHHRAAGAARHRRGGDRIAAQFAAIAHSRFWHLADMPAAFGEVRFRVQSGPFVLGLSISAFDPQRKCATAHSITLSARFSIVGATSRPSALAVLRLITISNVVGCSTGTSLSY
jgi:hypothetical protein